MGGGGWDGCSPSKYSAVHPANSRPATLSLSEKVFDMVFLYVACLPDERVTSIVVIEGGNYDYLMIACHSLSGLYFPFKSLL